MDRHRRRYSSRHRFDIRRSGFDDVIHHRLLSDVVSGFEPSPEWTSLFSCIKRDAFFRCFLLVSPPLVGVFNRKFRQEISTENFQRKIFQCRQSTSQSVDNQSTSQSTSQSTISQSTSQSVDNHISSACPSGQGGSVRRVAAVPALSPSSALCQSVRRGLFVGRRYRH